MFSYLNPLPSLPQYNGPHQVAITDYEIPVSEIPSTSTVPDSRISTIKFRIYYPTTSTATPKGSVHWLPDPQKQWNDAFASFLGANSKWSPWVSRLWSITNYIKIPVLRNGPLASPKSKTHPTCFFSHGLGGNTNIYSSIVGSLASCGIVTVVPEHRDGSSPTAFIRNAAGEIETTIPYQKLSHNPDATTLNARNAQLRVRMWELELMYTVIKGMNEGRSFTNYAQATNEPVLNLKSQLNLRPGQVAWAGHSFGAATITQFVKSIFYHQHLPQRKQSGKGTQEWDWSPLYQTQAGSDLVQQITADSPVALLDIWTMPLRGDSTSWLWERPMPCYAREPGFKVHTSTVAMISGEFYRYEGIFNRTRALLSKSPAKAIELIENGTERQNQPLPPAVEPSQQPSEKSTPSSPMAEISKRDDTSLSAPMPLSPSPVSFADSTLVPTTRPSPTSSQSSIELPTTVSPPSSESQTDSLTPKLFHIPNSAHLSQSDFGPLFPNLTKYAMKALDPHKTIELNVRAILAVMRGAGLEVEQLNVPGLIGEEYILGDGEASTQEGKEAGNDKETERRKKEAEKWVRVPLVQC